MRAVTVAAVVLAAGAAHAATLSPAGGDLGRVPASGIKGAFDITVDLPKDEAPTATHVIARFQNNQPLMRGKDGLWSPWNGDPGALEEAGASAANGKLVFHVLDALPADLFLPMSVTVVYTTDAGAKSGTLVVTGP